MRSFKKLGILAVAVFAFSAFGVANASAALFTASEEGEIEGKALETQTFTTTGGTVKCTKAHSTGETAGTEATEQHVTVNYSGCTAFGVAAVHISPATYLFTANGQVHIENDITIQVTVPIFPDCEVTVSGGQTVGTNGFSENGNNVVVEPNITGIHYEIDGPGTACGTVGSTGTNGTYIGDNEVKRVGGGTLSHDE